MMNNALMEAAYDPAAEAEREEENVVKNISFGRAPAFSVMIMNDNGGKKNRLTAYGNRMTAAYTTDKEGYRMIGGYRVREIFEGKESLTTLLTQYIERTIALH